MRAPAALAVLALLIVLLAVVTGAASHLAVDGGYLQVFQYTAAITLPTDTPTPTITPTANWSGIKVSIQNVGSSCENLSAEVVDNNGQAVLPGPVQWYLCHGKNNPSTRCDASTNYGSGLAYPEPDGRVIHIVAVPPQSGRQYFFKVDQPPGAQGSGNIFSSNIGWPPEGCSPAAQRLVPQETLQPDITPVSPTISTTPWPLPGDTDPIAPPPLVPPPTSTPTATVTATPEPSASPTAAPDTPTPILTGSPAPAASGTPAEEKAAPTATPSPEASPTVTADPAYPTVETGPAITPAP